MKLSKMPKGKRSESIKLSVVITIMATLLLSPLNGYPNDLEVIIQEVEAYLKAAHSTRTLKDFHYFEGEAGEKELELELQICASQGADAYSDQCVAYTRCRREKRDQVPSFYFTQLSEVLPKGEVIELWVDEAEEMELPHLQVHAKVGVHTLTFFKPTREDAFVPFGRLSLVAVDGKKVESSKIDLAGVPRLGPCEKSVFSD